VHLAAQLGSDILKRLRNVEKIFFRQLLFVWLQRKKTKIN